LDNFIAQNRGWIAKGYGESNQAYRLGKGMVKRNIEEKRTVEDKK
jgi:hypothetical protein